MSGFDHMSYSVGDLAKSSAFYDAALGAVGLSRISEFEYPGGKAIGYGAANERPILWISSGNPLRDHVHVAFVADSTDQVDAFYKAAMASGGRDNGGPGMRTNYYAAFVFDPDGHNIEAVYHGP